MAAPVGAAGQTAMRVVPALDVDGADPPGATHTAVAAPLTFTKEQDSTTAVGEYVASIVVAAAAGTFPSTFAAVGAENAFA